MGLKRQDPGSGRACRSTPPAHPTLAVRPSTPDSRLFRPLVSLPVLRIVAAALLCLALPAAAECPAAKDATRIAVAGGSLTEILYFMGEEDRIVAVDTTSNYPKEAMERFPSVGYVRNLSAEGLLSLEPTLILGENDMGPPEVLEQLAKTGVEVIGVPEEHDAAGIVAKVECIARVIGEDPNAAKKPLASVMAVLESVEPAQARVAMLFGLRQGVPMVAGAGTSGHGFLEMSGATNLFGDLEGWKPVSLEAMAKQNPEMLVITERGLAASGGRDEVLAHPSIRLTRAGKTESLVAKDGMAMLGFGPRTLSTAADFVRELRSFKESDGRGD